MNNSNKNSFRIKNYELYFFIFIFVVYFFQSNILSKSDKEKIIEAMVADIYRNNRLYNHNFLIGVINHPILLRKFQKIILPFIYFVH